MGRACSVHGRELVGEPEGEKPLERPKRKWEDNIKTRLKEMALHSSGSGQSPVVGSSEQERHKILRIC
jgi:hypothetical protein